MTLWRMPHLKDLIYAAADGYTFIALLFLRYGVNVESSDRFYIRPLHASAHAGTCFGSHQHLKSSRQEKVLLVMIFL